MTSTRIRQHINAPRAAVYRALLDPEAVAWWRVPAGMSCRVRSFDPREGGSIHLSLTYDAPTGTGKTTAHTDTYHGRFVKLVPDEQIVEVDHFETDDPAMRGAMTITITLEDAAGGQRDRLADGPREARGARRSGRASLTSGQGSGSMKLKPDHDARRCAGARVVVAVRVGRPRRRDRQA